MESKRPASFRAQEGENQNSISGSKRPIRRCQEVEKCKVTVHFTSDSVSVSLAASTVNFQRAVKVAGDRHLLLLLFIFTTAALSSTLLCFVFQLTGQGEQQQDHKQNPGTSSQFPPIPIVLVSLFPRITRAVLESSF